MIFDNHWERTVLLELGREYSNICRDRALTLRPASLRLFDSESLWGQFDALTRNLSISRKLVQNHSWEKVLGVLRHEMAHQYVYENSPYEHEEKPHGDLFQQACKKIGVPAPFTKARVGFQDASLDWKEDETDDTQERILDKVKKLLALASSKNEFEAALAMKKVQELYAQYNLDRAETSDRMQYVHHVIANGKKRQTAWEQRIISILLEYFFVEIIIIQQFDSKTGEKNQAFEMIGTRENVLMAEYVYYFLTNQVEYLLEQSSSNTRSEKASFRLGLLEGFAEKLSTKSSATNPTVITKALQKFKSDPNLKNYLKEIYPRLRLRKHSSRIIDPNAFQSGKHEGQKLVLNKPIENSKKSGLFLGSLRK